MSWAKKGRTIRVKTLEELKKLYSAGVNATLETQPETPWEESYCAGIVRKPGREPRGIARTNEKDKPANIIPESKL